MSFEVAIKVENIGKCYQIYDTPRARLKQFLLPRLRRVLGRTQRQYFREFWALRNVSLEVKRGETVGIIGRNGSGKSTLLQLICGTLSPTSGNIKVNGRVAALLELGSGFNPEFTGRENVYMNAAILGVNKNEIDARFDDIVAFAELSDFIEQPVKSYSSGMMMRLAFAVAINVEPEVLIVDEALSVGDELFQRKCFSKIEAVRAKGATILFVSHSASQIVELCDKAVIMDEGECLAVGASKQIVGRYQKLLYAPAQKRSLIRDEIKNVSDYDAGTLQLARDTATYVEPSRSANDGEEVGESYDPHLKPTSTIDYESHGAHITDPTISTVGGQSVNSLVAGRVYVYGYNVTFEKSVSHVRFGMLIKTTSGVELGGSSSASSAARSVVSAKAGEKIRVEFRFRCSLNAGVYFMNAGIVGNVDGNEVYLHRLVDAAMFRVAMVPDSLGTGLVDFDCQADVQPYRSAM